MLRGREKVDEEIQGVKNRLETPPFLTARNGSDHEAGAKSGDSNNSTTSYEINTPDESGESTPGDTEYYNDYDVDDLEESQPIANFSTAAMKVKRTRPKSAPS